MGGPGSGKKPRDYPAEIVALVCDMYMGGMTVAEVRRAAPRGYRVQTILERYLPARRAAIKRDQAGSNNDSWKGDRASYAAFHLRVMTARGRPSTCFECGTTEGKFEWANLTGHYEDVNDYTRLCTLCHRRYDAARRRLMGRRTSPAGRR